MSKESKPQYRGPMTHEVTIISMDRPIEIGVLEGNTIRITAQPAPQEVTKQLRPNMPYIQGE